MKTIVQNARSGAIELLEVPAPGAGACQILVRTAFSVMSPGTEKLALDFARKSLLAKARSRPDLVRQVVRKLRQEGPLPTYRAVMNRLDAPQPLGYSSAGVVEAVGPGVDGLSPGDRVACAGAGYASHAELVVVPENLAARVPEGVRLEHAAFATLGAIALQGLRVGSPVLGEIVAVVGLGLIGQLTLQLLLASGCRVLAIDLDPERVKQARTLGAEWGASPTDDLESWRDHAAAGHGADLTVVTASSDTSAPLRMAADLCRMRGRIVMVGAMPVELDRRLLYEKELELRMSMSYGPGRYDRRYEEEGLDYPLAYVRWTENRNLQAFLHAVASGSVRPDALDAQVVPFEKALEAYEELAKGQRRSLATLFEYSTRPARNRTLSLRRQAPESEQRTKPAGDKIGLAVIGAGNYAKGMLLPHLAQIDHVRPTHLVAATGTSARRSAERFGFPTCGTDAEVALRDPTVDLVVVATRHDSHADLATRALRAGKAVWLEKPVALDEAGLAEVELAARETGGFLTVGYNRRFSAHAGAIRDVFAQRQGPLAIHYAVAAGPPPRGTWVTDPQVGGGRLIGEACHFVDLCVFLVGDVPRSVFARALARDHRVDDSAVTLLDFPDGSTACIEYLANAGADLPKERIEVSGDGRTARCDNFRETRISGKRRIRTLNQDKGQRAALDAVIAATRLRRPSPVPLEEIVAVSRATFAIVESVQSGRVVAQK